MADLSAYRFSPTHEWVRRDAEGVTVGITDHAQSQLGDVIFLELPAVGATLAAGEKFGVIESVKAASDLYLPVGGTVAEVNTRLTDSPELVNSDPYGDGWMVRLKDVSGESSGLMDSAAYEALTAG